MILTEDQVSFEPRDGWIEHKGTWYHPGLRGIIESGLVPGFEDYEQPTDEQMDGSDA